MKILTKKMQNDIISLLCENAEIALCRNLKSDIDIEDLCKINDNTVKLCRYIGGCDGALMYLNLIIPSLDEYTERTQNENEKKDGGENDR